MDNSLGLCVCCHVLPVLLLSSVTAACHCRSGLSMTVLLLPSGYQVPGLLSHLSLTTIPWGNSILTLNLQMREPKLTKWLALRSARWLAEPRVSTGSLTAERALLSVTPCPPPLPSERWIRLYLSYLRQRMVWAQQNEITGDSLKRWKKLEIQRKSIVIKPRGFPDIIPWRRFSDMIICDHLPSIKRFPKGWHWWEPSDTSEEITSLSGSGWPLNLCPCRQSRFWDIQFWCLIQKDDKETKKKKKHWLIFLGIPVGFGSS